MHMKSKDKKDQTFSQNANNLTSSSQPISVAKKRVFTIILIFLPLLFLILLEAGLQIFNYGGNLDLFILKKTGQISEFVLNKDFTKRYFFKKGVKTPIPLSQAFNSEKDSLTYRVFCLGASTTQGFPYPPYAGFPAILENILSTLHPERKVEVVNCGVTAITSHSVLDMGREILRKYQPDLLVVYTGHNEFYGVFGQASTLSLFENRTLLQIFLKMQHSKLFLLLRNTLNMLFGERINRESMFDTSTLMGLVLKDIGIQLNNDIFRRTENHFQENIEDLIKEAKQHHTDILICNLLDNLRDFAPFASMHSENFWEKDTTQWYQLIKSAEEFQNSGNYQQAIDHYLQALKIDSCYAQTNYQLAQSYDALLNFDLAGRYYLLAKDFDVIRFRAPSSFNHMIREATNKYNVPLVDLEKTFSQISPAGIIGNNLLHEHVHPNQKGYLQMARAISKTMSEHGLIRDAWNWTRDQTDSAYLAMSHVTLLDYEVVNYSLFRLTSHWPFTNSGEERVYQPVGNERTVQLAKFFIDEEKGSLVELHLEYGNEFHEKNQFKEAEAEYQAAHAIQPIQETYNRLGRLELRKTEITYRDLKAYDEAFRSYQRGIFYFKEGLKRWPDDLELNFNLGLLYFMRNDQTEASLKCFQKVMELDPDNKKALRQLSELYVRRYEFENAKSCLRKAIELYPEEARFYTELGLVYMRQNNFSEAEKWLKKAVETDNDLKAKYYLHQVRSKLLKESQK